MTDLILYSLAAIGAVILLREFLGWLGCLADNLRTRHDIGEFMKQPRRVSIQPTAWTWYRHGALSGKWTHHETRGGHAILPWELYESLREEAFDFGGEDE